MPKVSIIVPCYNAEKYIANCIQSILQQNYDYIELIVIIDGTDNKVLSICENYSQENDNIVVHSYEENLGASIARNKGIEIATGDLICFIDADDWVEKTYIENLYNEFKVQNADLVISNMKSVFPNKIIWHDSFEKQNLYSLKRDGFVPDELFINNYFLLRNSPCAKLFKKSLIDDNCIQFQNKLKYGEDLLFVLEYSLRCQKIRFINDYDYNYNNMNNFSVTAKYDDRYYDNLKNTKDALFNIFEKYREVTNTERLYNYFKVASKAIHMEGNPLYERSFWKRYKKIQRILNKKDLKSFRKNYKLKDDSSEEFFVILRKLMKYNLAFVITLFLTVYYKYHVRNA